MYKLMQITVRIWFWINDWKKKKKNKLFLLPTGVSIVNGSNWFFLLDRDDNLNDADLFVGSRRTVERPQKC